MGQWTSFFRSSLFQGFRFDLHYVQTGVLMMLLIIFAVVKAMASSDKSWEAMVSFCEQVMSQKEAAERLREDDVESQLIRRRRIGRRRLACPLDEDLR
ncbi:jg16052 [Pararge aegeria aegeria]|uniref:Jg16052 protein n=1 Tax=Pararge aegeria aegeria TaxID=348720 RepID=A0A8S4SPI2_9NEOP|nr:jg16052 [Pararge aegeria aegeria]